MPFCDKSKNVRLVRHMLLTCSHRSKFRANDKLSSPVACSRKSQTVLSNTLSGSLPKRLSSECSEMSLRDKLGKISQGRCTLPDSSALDIVCWNPSTFVAPIDSCARCTLRSCMYTCVCIYAYMYMRVCVYMYRCICMYMNVCMYMYVCGYKYILSLESPCLFACLLV